MAVFASLHALWADNFSSLPLQAAIVFLCLLSGAVIRALMRHSPLSTIVPKTWQTGLLISLAAIWLAFGILANGLQPNELVRVAAIMLSAIIIVRIALGGIGRTALGGVVVTVTICAALLEALHLGAPAIAILDAPHLDFGRVRVTPWFAIRAIVICTALFWTAQHVGDLIARGFSREQVFSRSDKALFAKLARAVLYALALVLALGFLGVDITALAVLSGAVGLGLGFGLQKIVSNYVSGLILLIDRSIKPGDVIEVEFAGERMRGEVTELAGRYTAITLRTGTETLIPNEVLVSSPVSNWSHTSRNVQIRIPVGVAYSTDIERAMALCVEAAASAPRVLNQPAPVCFIVGFGESSVDLEVRYWIADSELGIRSVSSTVYLEIWKRFQTNKIEIPFPQRDVHIRSTVQQ
jgi:small-conductance mechanosensitive channel